MFVFVAKFLCCCISTLFKYNVLSQAGGPVNCSKLLRIFAIAI